MKAHEPYVIEDHKLTLCCETSSGNPDPRITWYENDQLAISNHLPQTSIGEFYGKVTTEKYTTKVIHYYKNAARKIKCCLNSNPDICQEMTPYVECKLKLEKQTNKQTRPKKRQQTNK